MEKKIKRWSFEKKNIAKVAIAVVLLSVSVLFLTRGCASLVVTQPGFETIALQSVEPDIPPPVGKVYPYYGEIQLAYYFDSEGNARVNERKAVEAAYNQALAPIFRLLDSDRTYTLEEEVIHNLAYVNQHPNTPIVLEETLYDMVKTAYQFMLDSGGIYNIYAGELEFYWQDRLQKFELGEEIQIYDPLTSESSRTILENLVTQINQYRLDPTQGLEFEDTSHQVTLHVAPAYVDIIKLDLQLLEHAFVFDYLFAQLSPVIEKGFLTSYYGYSMTLGEHPTSENGVWIQNLISPNQQEAQFQAGTAFVSATLSDYGYLSYTMVDETEAEFPRHLAYSALTGYQENTARVVSFTSTSGSALSQLGYQALLGMMEEESELTSRMASLASISITTIALMESSSESDVYRLLHNQEIIGFQYAVDFMLEEIN